MEWFIRCLVLTTDTGTVPLSPPSRREGMAASFITLQSVLVDIFYRLNHYKANIFPLNLKNI